MVYSERQAILSEVVGGHLEVMVCSGEEVSDSHLRAFKNNPSVNVLGYIAFSNQRTPFSIAANFAAVYRGGGEVMQQAQDKKFATIEYPLSFKPVLTTAFVNYFGHD